MLRFFWPFSVLCQTLLDPSLGNLFNINIPACPPRPENNGTAIGVDAICTYQPNTSNEGLDRKRLYWELRRLNKGIMKLGPYTLDKNSLYVNGELYFRVMLLSSHTTSQPHPISTLLLLSM